MPREALRRALRAAAQDFLHQGSKLFEQEILKIKAAEVFPVLTAERASRAGETRPIVLRALQDSPSVVPAGQNLLGDGFPW